MYHVVVPRLTINHDELAVLDAVHDILPASYDTKRNSRIPAHSACDSRSV
jgi:hypothetical protein